MTTTGEIAKVLDQVVNRVKECLGDNVPDGVIARIYERAADRLFDAALDELRLEAQDAAKAAASLGGHPQAAPAAPAQPGPAAAPAAAEPTRDVESCMAALDPKTGRLNDEQFKRWMLISAARRKAGKTLPRWGSAQPKELLEGLTGNERYILLTGG